MPATLRKSVGSALAAVVLATAVLPAGAQNPFEALKRSAEAEARRQAEQALRRATQPRPAPAPQPSAPPATAPGAATPAPNPSAASTPPPAPNPVAAPSPLPPAAPAPASWSAPPTAAYEVAADGTVTLRNAPYPRNPRYGGFPTPPLMRMPAPLVLLPPGIVQTPVWSTASASWTEGRTPADEQEFPPDGECRWYLETRRAGLATPQDAARQGIAVAEMNALRTAIEPVGPWLSSRPALARPVGVCALFGNYGLYATPAEPVMIDAGYALRGYAMLGFWPGAQLKRRGERVVADGEIPHLILQLNRLPDGGRSRRTIEDAAGTMFEEEPVTHTVQGFPVHFNTDLYIPRNDRPLTRPVRIDRLLRWQIAAIDPDLEIRRRDAARAAEQLAAMESPEQRARDERTIELRAQASFGGDLARARASFEGDRAGEMGRLRARANTEDPAHPVQELLRMRAAAERALASATPATAAPGCLTSAVAGTTVPDVVGVDDPNCVHRMEEANPDYYDRSLPRSAVQLVRISRFPLQRPNSRPAAGNHNVVMGVDWRAFRDELLKPREP